MSFRIFISFHIVVVVMSLPPRPLNTLEFVVIRQPPNGGVDAAAVNHISILVLRMQSPLVPLASNDLFDSVGD
jgi:hypothetical protein